MKTHGAASTGILYSVVATEPLVAGRPTTIVLTGTGPFKGFLLDSADGTLSDPSAGAPYKTCGIGHNEASPKDKVTATFTPAAGASSATFTGFLLNEVKTWHTVSVTLPVKSAAAVEADAHLLRGGSR